MPRRPFASTGYAFGAIAFLVGALLHLAIGYFAFQTKSYWRVCFAATMAAGCLMVARGAWRRLKLEREEEKIL